MRPWQHARSSAGRNGDWLADLPIHEFMDSTKAACPDLRHRMVLHNADLGPELAARAFPHRSDARAIAQRHVREDLGCLPTLEQWLDCCDLAQLPRPLPRRLPIRPAEMAGLVARAQGLPSPDAPTAILDLLLLPTAFAGLDAIGVLLNSAAPMLVRSIFGPARPIPGPHGPATLDPAHVAEALAYRLFGEVVPLMRVAAAVKRAPASGGAAR